MIAKLKKPLSLLIPMLFPILIVIFMLLLVPQKVEAGRNSSVDLNNTSIFI